MPISNPSMVAAFHSIASVRYFAFITEYPILCKKNLMETLTRFGRADVALALAEILDYPSWGYMV